MSTEIFEHEKTQEENEEEDQDERKLNRLQLEIYRLQQQIDETLVRLQRDVSILEETQRLFQAKIQDLSQAKIQILQKIDELVSQVTTSNDDFE